MFDDVKLGSVNWELGMLLKPEHFLRQERYFDSRMLWLLRYTNNCYGLVGGGPRLPEVERGAKGDDPVVSVNDDADTLSITVAQCRGITPAGCFVDINPERPVYFEVPKADLEGVSDSRIYIVCDPTEKELAAADEDRLNPQHEKEWFPSYRLTLKVNADQAPYALAVGRIVRARGGVEFDRDPEFIPACAFMDAHSELAAGAREIQEEVTKLASRFTELHRAMRQFLTLFKDRGIETDNDVETMAFTGRMVTALQNCVYEIVDTTQAPQAYFGHLRRFIHSAAVYLDLSPPVRQYFDLLKESGETEFITLLAQQSKSLGASPKWRIYEDLADEVASALQSIGALQKLERALEGKYIDFRVNPVLESMNFIFDREGQVLYKLHGSSSRVQGTEDMRTMTFASLQLAGREKYRLVLVGEEGAVIDREMRIEVHINENTGFRGQPKFLKCSPKPGQINFDFDFDAPETPTISDLRVTLMADLPIRVGMLFVRQRFFAERKQEPARPLEPEEKRRPEPREEPPRPRPSAAAAASDRGTVRRFRTDDTARQPRDAAPPPRSGRDAPSRFVQDNDPGTSRRQGRDPDAGPSRREDNDRRDATWDARRDRDKTWSRDDEPPPQPPRRSRFRDS